MRIDRDGMPLKNWLLAVCNGDRQFYEGNNVLRALQVKSVDRLHPIFRWAFAGDERPTTVLSFYLPIRPLHG
jgi:hypothetical protein